MSEHILLEGRHLVKTFPMKKDSVLHAVSDVSLSLYEGETLALAGESGCGKTTLGRLLLGLLPPTEGEVFFDGKNLQKLSPEALRALRREMQMIFQDSAAALNPRLDVLGLLSEPLRIHRLCPKRDYPDRCAALLRQVGLSPDLLSRYPHELSGGQRQRVGIARALALSPRLLVCDEPVSALDVSLQAQILNLLSDLKQERRCSCLLISHDLSVVRHLADRVCIMFAGRICELGPVQEVFAHPRHPYTRFLLDAVPRPDPDNREAQLSLLAGEPPSPVHPPSGCRFRTRCPRAGKLCAEKTPELHSMGNVEAACHFPL